MEWRTQDKVNLMKLMNEITLITNLALRTSRFLLITTTVQHVVRLLQWYLSGNVSSRENTICCDAQS